ncbi:hypothetical protein B0F90DRAFT_1717263 [Multifurca ochricompacta]|uniref:Bromo domain-containing protein n=1 Tax=Multifurca ochricompacta TaxID=376703 RepID=A0AAD4M615_9AGAM|nr:hypothetical protein B0F90DRAFT_1717263 [Multifurca ochricompacta]
MNNLLRSLANSQVKPPLSDIDLKRLFQVVKDSRQKQPHDAKLADAFYDGLEDLLLDLRTVTMDNHDADAFIKPVSKADVPDYHDIITTPMDFQTMLKKVKQKQYKSKKEFKDDLDLIWSNCFVYNATENHPLRLCATRLKAKAEHLLKYITDRKERADPPVPIDLSSPTSGRRAPSHPPIRLNGLNGHVHSLSLFPSRPPSSNDSRTGRRLTPAPTPPRRVRGQSFQDSPAIVRTAEGMTAIHELEQSLDAVLSAPGPSSNAEALNALLRSYIGESDSDADGEVESDSDGMAVDGATGDKRKPNGILDSRVRKRARLSVPRASDTIELWWGAQSSDTFIANSLPPLPSLAASGPVPPPSPPRLGGQPVSSTMTKRRKKRPPKPAPPRPRSLLAMMNANISTQRRMRRTHVKFAALSAAAAATSNTGGEDGEGGDVPTIGVPAGATGDLDGSEDAEADAVDERPWPVPRPSRKSEGIGELAAEKCMQWVNRKILEHVGFQGSSQLALDVVSGITVEYLSNLGRTFRFYLDKYSNTLTAEEIILHSLLESGASRIQGLERYITDDVIRHGNRLNELEKKITNVYQEFTSTEAIDEALFANEEEEEEESAFVIAKSAEPPPPYPPPEPFVAITSENVKNQIGLLRGYFEHRLASSKLDTVADDPPNPTQAKLGPLGQVIRPSSAAIAAAAAGSKKKSKPKDAAATGGTATSISTSAATTMVAGMGVVGTSTTVGIAVGAIETTATIGGRATVATIATGGAGAGAGAGTGAGGTGGVVAQVETPVPSSAGVSSPQMTLASIATSSMTITAGAGATSPVADLQTQTQSPKKKKSTPGAGTGTGTSAGAGSAGSGGGSGGSGSGSGSGGGGGGGTGKKRGRPPEGLPPVVVASA